MCEGRRSARSHFAVSLTGDTPGFTGNRTVGEVTSGAFSPCLKKGIGLCYIEKEFAAEDRSVILSDEKTEIRAVVRDVPIYKAVKN